MINHRRPLKRRSELKRGAPPKRKAPPRRRKPKPRPNADPAYLDWIHRQPCCAHRLSTCEGKLEAHHAGKNPGLGLKAPDATCIPLCSYHHAALGSFYGPFRAWDGGQARRWQDEQIAEHRSRYLAQEGRF